MLLQYGIEGLLLTPIWTQPAVAESLHLLQSLRLPVTYVDMAWPELPGPLVGVDNIKAGRLIADHLLELGHRSILFCVTDETRGMVTVADRIVGVREAVEMASGAQIEVHSLVDEVTADAERLADHISQLRERPGGPTAIVCQNDWLAIRVMTALMVRGIKMPGEIALAGFDDVFYPILKYATGREQIPFDFIPLTTIRQPLRQIGRRAAERLIAQLEGRDAESPEVERLDVELIVRSTTRPANGVTS